MGIVLFYGDNQVESREKLHELKQKAKRQEKEIIEFDGGSLTLTAVIQSAEAQSLFSQDKVLIIENLYSARKNNDEIIQYIKKGKFDIDIVLWEPKKIDGRKINWIKEKFEFSYPKILFKFLESIGSSFKENTLKLFNELVKTQPVELVYYMIVRQFRMLLLVKSNSTDANIKETKRLQNWQISRLKQQFANTNLDNLLRYYQQLMYIDYQQKTGQSSLSLKQTLDIFLSQV